MEKIERKFGLGVLICVFNKDFSKILLLKRNEEKRKKNNADWGCVGGRVELGEKLIDACVREAREEIGVNLQSSELKLIDIKESPFLSEVFHAVHFVYATILDEKVKIILNNESDEYNWFSLNNLPERTLDSKEELNRLASIAKSKCAE